MPPRDTSGDLAVAKAFHRLETALRSRPLSEIKAVGGDVAFLVRGANPVQWSVVVRDDGVSIVPEPSKSPICRIGIVSNALSALVDGTLDVPRAFRERRMAIDGDLGALGRFAECFAVPRPPDLWSGVNKRPPRKSR